MATRSDDEHANKLEQWAKDGKEGLPPVLAATVILQSYLDANRKMTSEK